MFQDADDNPLSALYRSSLLPLPLCSVPRRTSESRSEQDIQGRLADRGRVRPSEQRFYFQRQLSWLASTSASAHKVCVFNSPAPTTEMSFAKSEMLDIDFWDRASLGLRYL